MTTTVKVKFRPSTVADRPGRIVYFITYRRATRLITTEYKVFSSEWDERNCMVKAVDPSKKTLARTINQRLRWDMECLARIIKDFDERNYNYSFIDVVEEFKRIVRESSLFNFMEDYILRLQQLNHSGTAHNYRATLNSFKRFRKGEDILMETIDHILIEDYQAWLRANRLATNSIAFYMRILRAVYNRAVNQGLTQNNRPFGTISTGMERTRKRAISIKDIKRIQDLDICRFPSLTFARDIFMFLFYCRGMSFIDAAFLKKTDIKEGVIIYRRRKTNQPLFIKVVKQIQTIINRYYIEDSPYLLPIISEPGNNEYRQYTTALRRINNALKSIGKILGIDVSLTTYVTRHSWASIAKSKNISVNVISDALGHDNVITTQTYLSSINTSIIDRANALVIKDL